MSGKIFINYRREDVKNSAARIRDRLVGAFGPDAVFMDVDNLAPGQRFDVALQDALFQTIGADSDVHILPMIAGG